MQNCGRLREYARFVYEVKQSLSFGMPLERAVNTAIDTCIQQDVLKDILMQSKSEILEMFLTEYDKKLHMENTYREEPSALQIFSLKNFKIPSLLSSY